jgi:glyoxylase-like metal-dependent hydrolase (beta-lactamase superfamily II)
MMKITGEVYAVGSGRHGLGISNEYDCNVFLIDGGDELALIDAGCGYDVEPIVANIRSAGFEPTRVSRLLLTHAHADHCGASAALRERLALDVALSSREAEFLEQGDEAAISLDRARAEGIYPADFRLVPCSVDRRLSHGDEICCGRLVLRAVEVGGHSAGSVCYLLTGGERLCLFSGDTVFLLGRISLLNCEGSSLEGYRRDIKRLADLGVEALLPGHGGFCLGGGQSHIDEAIDTLRSVWPPSNYR